MARLAIKRENFEFNKLSSLEVASMFGKSIAKDLNYGWYLVMSNSENFVGHICVQEVFDAVWCAETSHKVNSMFMMRRISRWSRT